VRSARRPFARGAFDSLGSASHLHALLVEKLGGLCHGLGVVRRRGGDGSVLVGQPLAESADGFARRAARAAHLDGLKHDATAARRAPPVDAGDARALAAAAGRKEPRNLDEGKRLFD
jgi:hypothetical protein